MGFLDNLFGSSSGGGGIPNVDLQWSNLPIVGSLFPDEATREMQRQMTAAGKSMAAYRPEVMQARQNAIMNQMAALQGGNDILTAMAGGRQMFNPANMQAPIFGPSAFSQGAIIGVDTPEVQAQKIARGNAINNALFETGREPGQRVENWLPVNPALGDFSGQPLPATTGVAPDIWGAPEGSFATPSDAQYFDPESPYYLKENPAYVGTQPAWEWQPQNGRW